MPRLRKRYVFPASRGRPPFGVPSAFLTAFLVASRGSLRLVTPTTASYGVMLVIIVGVAFGAIGAMILFVHLMILWGVGPWTDPWHQAAFGIGFVVGFILLLILGQMKAYSVALRMTAARARRWKPVEVRDIHFGRIVHRIDGMTTGERVEIFVEGSRRSLERALEMARLPLPRGAQPGEQGWPLEVDQEPPALRTTLNLGGIAIVLFLVGLLSLYVWLLWTGDWNPFWILAIGLFGSMLVWIVRVVIRTRRHYCPSCDGIETFSEKHGVWRCGRCGRPRGLPSPSAEEA